MGDCGVYAVFLEEGGLTQRLYEAGLLLQHRGYDAFGFGSFEDGPRVERRKGTIGRAGNLPDVTGKLGILHVRYATVGPGETLLKNSQPVRGEGLITAHNGQVTNIRACREWIQERGLELEGFGDGELITRVLEYELREKGLEEAVNELFDIVKGGYSVVGLRRGEVFAFRDPLGTKPLYYSLGEGFEVASETHALRGEAVEVKPGELVVYDGTLRRHQLREPGEHFCAFELNYFMHPAASWKGIPVAEWRKRLGKKLVEEYSLDVDCIVSVPSSADDVAMGMAEASGKEYVRAIIRNRHVSERSFLINKNDREYTLRRKYSFARGYRSKLKGKKVALVEDSIVRGSTLRAVLGRFRGIFEPAEIHVFVSFPPLQYPCLHGGIDMATYGQFIVNSVGMDGLAEELGVESVNYISERGYREVFGDRLCLACHNGRYPLPEAQELSKLRSDTRLYEL